MVKTGLDCFCEQIPPVCRGKRIGVVCHAASVASDYTHVLDILASSDQCRLSAVAGPQHGLFGQTQDNMIEWEGVALHPHYQVPVFSLYGRSRTPSRAMLDLIDVLIVDLQDVGARPYTYIWTVKNCMEACVESGIGMVVLDRPNPVSAMALDGPILDPDYFSFVGGATIPLCHRMTIGEMALLLQSRYFPRLELNVVAMQGWWRDSLMHETGLPWVLPSPNMPTLDTAMVYPGMVLLEATNLSEGRGTTRPFELFGAPYIDGDQCVRMLRELPLDGCVLREHSFIPTFQKWQGMDCWGMQIHVTDPRRYAPVYTTAVLLRSIIEVSRGQFAFKQPPYEYEYTKMPFDILSGDSALRAHIEQGRPDQELIDRWQGANETFWGDVKPLLLYAEKCP